MPVFEVKIRVETLPTDDAMATLADALHHLRSAAITSTAFAARSNIDPSPSFDILGIERKDRK